MSSSGRPAAVVGLLSAFGIGLARPVRGSTHDVRFKLWSMKNTRPFGAICIDQFEGSPELSRLVEATPAAGAPDALLAVPLSLLLPALELSFPLLPAPAPPSSDELCRDWFWASDEADEEADRMGAALDWIGVWNPPLLSGWSSSSG